MSDNPSQGEDAGPSSLGDETEIASVPSHDRHPRVQPSLLAPFHPSAPTSPSSHEHESGHTPHGNGAHDPSLSTSIPDADSDSLPSTATSQNTRSQTPSSTKSRPIQLSATSPVNLPVRSGSDETSSLNISGSPLRTLSPTKPPSQILSDSPESSPQRQIYLEKSIPVQGELATPKIGGGHPMLATVHPHLSEVSLKPDTELIFDDHDHRLPPAQDSPSHLSATDADIIAISSPEMQGGYHDYSRSTHLDDQFEENHEYVPRENLRTEPLHDAEDSAFGRYDQSIEEIDLYETIPHVLRVPLSPHHPDYPAPIPTKLMRPPRLSGRRHSRSTSLNLPPPPDWSQSPNLETEYEFVTTSGDGLVVTPYTPDIYEESDVESDRATIMSDDRDDLEDARTDKPIERNGDKSKKKGTVKWIRSIFKSQHAHGDEAEDEMGDVYDDKEAQVLRRQMAVIDDDLAFSRLDPETVQRHAQMFNAGGIHSSIAPRSGGPTSLIEELEIRKAGKRVQRQVFFREVAEMERQRQEDSAKTNWVHPASADPSNVQPTLLQMQYMAEVDYKNRVQWHTRAINHNYIHEHADETLAQRRARLKAEKQRMNQEAAAPAEETLAQRRARLRREKMESLSLSASPSVRSLDTPTSVSSAH